MANRAAAAKRQGFWSRVRNAAAFIVGGTTEPNYDAGNTSRRTRTWGAGLTGPNSVITGGLHMLRNRSRDITRKVPLIAGAYDTIVANIIGPGITIKSAGPDAAYRDTFKELFDDWCTYCDADAVVDFQGFLGLAVRGRLEAGEVFIRHRPRRVEDGFTVPYQIQLLEAEMVPVEKNELLPNGNRVIAGIEFDQLGRRVAYWMYRNHPGDALVSGQPLDWVRVPAREVIHYFKPLRPGQVRGIPVTAPALVKIRDWSIYDDAELVKKQVSALMTGIITSPSENVINEDEDDPDADLGEAVGKLEPGAMIKLLPGEDVKFSQPADSGLTYEPFTKMVLRCIAAVFGLTYEQLTNDLSQANFSSIRAGKNEAERKFRMEQMAIIHQIIRPVLAYWTEQAVLAGVLSAPNFALMPQRYNRVRAQPPGWSYVNPQQEIAAVKEEIKGGLQSRAGAAADRGRDIEEIDRQNAEDHQRAEGAGLSYDTMGVPASDRVVAGNDNGGPPLDDGDGRDADGRPARTDA